jgi:hypothetical protein
MQRPQSESRAIIGLSSSGKGDVLLSFSFSGEWGSEVDWVSGGDSMGGVSISRFSSERDGVSLLLGGEGEGER